MTVTAARVRAGRFLFLRNSAAESPTFLKSLQHHRVDVAQQYELDRLDLAAYAAVLLTIHTDQHHLMENRAKLDAYLEGGGAILFNGHVVRPFLPELTLFEPLEVKGLASLVINREAQHPIFAGIGTELLTYNKGVAGFYARGSNPPPPGAIVLHSVGPERMPVDWIARRPSGGRLLVHSGNDIFSFLIKPDPEGLTSLQRLFDWFLESADEASRRD